jgi:hypothetical protein
LIEYYGVKGQKGTRRLARWSPNPNLLMQRRYRISEANDLAPDSLLISESEAFYDGILLEGATEDDLGATLHLRGAILHPNGVVYSPSMFFDKEDDKAKAATPYLWYRSVIRQTLRAEPVLHCHGLHEW